MFRKKLTVFLTLILLLHSSQELVMDKAAYDIAIQLCPYTNFCFKRANESALSLMKYPSRKEPCCNQCSCEDNCWETHNCCPDKIYNNDTTTQEVIGKCTSSLVKGGTETLFVHHFRVLDTCGYANYTKEIRSKCEGEISSMEEFIWVSDAVTGKVYRNRYCALCNAVDVYAPWNIWTVCHGLSYQTFMSFEGVMSDSCPIVFYPPEDLQYIVTKYRCYADILGYSECNREKLKLAREDYRDVVDSLCEMSDWPLQPQLLHPRIPPVQKNVFCVSCNTDEYTAICTKPTAPKSQNKLTTLLNFDFLFTERKNSKDNCAVNEVFDSYMVSFDSFSIALPKYP